MTTVFNVLRTSYFDEWLQNQSKMIQSQVLMRLDRIEHEGHFGKTHFFDGIIELKWKSGLRVYSARVDTTVILLLAGGTKHGQNKDIQKAKKYLQQFKENDYNET